MKARFNPHGYTIVEVMIFLAVSGGLFVIAATLLSGQQGKTEFSQAAREVHSQIQDTINDVATGYYPDTGTATCAASAASAGLGTNEGCIFIGHVIEFGTTEYSVHTVAGNRTFTPPSSSEKKEVINFKQANPALAPGPAVKTLQKGLTISKVSYKKAGTLGNIQAIGLLGSFGQYSTTAGDYNLVSGDLSVDVLPLTSAGVMSGLDDTTSPPPTPIQDRNPTGGIYVCFDSAATDQFSIITIGSNNRQLTTTLEIVDGLPTGALAGVCS